LEWTNPQFKVLCANIYIAAMQQASNLYQPIIDRKTKAEKLRSTLNVLDRFKFFFNLPASLDDSIRKVTCLFFLTFISNI
jgi:hypothetical protein